MTATMSLEQVGQKLKSAREAQNLTLGQVYDRIRISTSNLEAIEEGRLEDLPEPVYVAGFIKRYGDMLGLSGQTLVEEYKRTMTGENGKGNGLFGIVKNSQPIAAPTVSYVAPPRLVSDAPSFTKTFFYPSLLLVAVVASVSGLLWWQQQQLAQQQDPSVLALRDSTSRFNAAGMQVAAGTSQMPTAQVPSVLPASTGKITLAASQYVWVEVKSMATGAPLFTGYLEAGDKRDFQDPQGLTVRAGNGGSLSVTDFTGKTEVMGAPGKVKEITYTPPAQTQPGAAAQVADQSSGASSASTGAVKPVTNVKRPISYKRSVSDAAGTGERRPRRLDDGGTRDIPGISSGGGIRSIETPYRYNDGRLDNE